MLRTFVIYVISKGRMDSLEKSLKKGEETKIYIRLFSNAIPQKGTSRIAGEDLRSLDIRRFLDNSK